MRGCALVLYQCLINVVFLCRLCLTLHFSKLKVFSKNTKTLNKNTVQLLGDASSKEPQFAQRLIALKRRYPIKMLLFFSRATILLEMDFPPAISLQKRRQILFAALLGTSCYRSLRGITQIARSLVARSGTDALATCLAPVPVHA